MKFMKLGNRPDTFYTEEATRTVTSDMPSDLILQIGGITYFLHKFALLPKCGLLQQHCTGASDEDTINVDLSGIPGGEDSFELCAKYCYGITINLGAHNFLPAFCAAKFLRMTESVEKGNFIQKLEAFFRSCILEGWKDSIISLQTTTKLPEWSETLGIVRLCIDSIVEKILTPPPKVSWSYTYTRPGYNKKQHQSVPRDWWTEDISDLHIDLFRSVIVSVRSTNMLPSQLIGEALHVYAIRWLPDTTKTRPTESSASRRSEEITEKNRHILEVIASMIPPDLGSVSISFLLRLLSLGNYLGASSLTKTELIRRSSQQLDEATVSDLLFPSQSDQFLYDVDLVRAVVESFWVQWRRRAPSGSTENGQSVRSVWKVGKLIDSYLQVIAKDVDMPVSKIISLAESLPDIARPLHDELYKAINTYLKEHPDLSKEEKKSLCRILDCQKLSPEVRAHAVKNERLPLRTVVQVLYFDQEKSAGLRGSPHTLAPSEMVSKGKEVFTMKEDQGKRKPTPELHQLPAAIDNGMKDHTKTIRPETKLSRELERKLALGEAEDVESSSQVKAKDIGEDQRARLSTLNPRNIIKRTGKSDHPRPQ